MRLDTGPSADEPHQRQDASVNSARLVPVSPGGGPVQVALFGHEVRRRKQTVRAMTNQDQTIDSPIARDDPEAAAVFPREFHHLRTAYFLLDGSVVSEGVLKFLQFGVSQASVGDVCVLNRDKQGVLAAVQSSEFPPVDRPAWRAEGEAAGSANRPLPLARRA